MIIQDVLFDMEYRKFKCIFISLIPGSVGFEPPLAHGAGDRCKLQVSGGSPKA